MAELLALEGLSAGWGAARVLSGVSLALAEGESLALLGRNGMGKTTLLAAILGIAAQGGGIVRFGGRDITRLRTEARAQAGIGWVPQERNIFRSLTVVENLTAVARPGRWDVASVWEMFPRLGERRRNLGYQLSGGEQQMLAIGRALVLNPRLLLLDEPTEGLAPIIVAELLGVLRRLTRESGLSAIIVEQHARKVLDVTDRAVILERGQVAHAAASAALAGDAATLDRYLGVGASQ
jgi:branched-chain amino acid transport system ATP-binding protein